MNAVPDPLPWFGPVLGEAEKAAVLDVLDSQYVNDGAVTRDFEHRIADIVGVRFCVGVTSGTAALALALMGLGVGPGDEVIVPDLTFVATANAVSLAGAEVRLVDIEPDRFTIDPERVAAAIGPRTRAVVPVDVNGRGADYRAIEPLCRDHGLALVCDSAEALGSAFDGKPLGSYGDAGCFSFTPAKTVTTGQGGMIATNDEALHHRLLELKDQGRRRPGTGGGDDDHPVVGFNFKLTNLQAAVGLAQLDRLGDRLAQAEARDRWYWQRLRDCPGVDAHRLDGNPGGEARQWADALIDDRPAMEAALTRAGIGFRSFWKPLHTQAPYARPDDGFETAIRVAARGLWLPSHFTLTEDQAARACAAIRAAASA